MIFYFSGTGNSKHIAQRIGEKMGGEVLQVSQCTPYAIPDNGEAVGFVFPVYFWGIPTAAVRFLSALKIAGKHYTYLVLDCGGSTGDASGMAEKLLGRKFDAVFSVLMPDTYVPMFYIADDVKNRATLAKAESVIDNIIAQVQAQATGDFNQHRGLGKFYTATMYPLYKRKTTEPFRVTTDCVGCGRCAEVCPDSLITLADGRPQWKPAHCNLCFACLHHCPAHAITYGKRSHKNGQYLFPEEG